MMLCPAKTTKMQSTSNSLEGMGETTNVTALIQFQQRTYYKVLDLKILGSI